MAEKPRRFTIGDGMILVVAAALATLLVRDYSGSLKSVYKTRSVDRLILLVEGPATCIASALMLALIPIRLRRPRPGLRRLGRQPGFAACSAVAAALAVGGAEGLALVAFRVPSQAWGAWPFQQLWTIGAGRCPYAIAGAWLVLAAGGRWRAEPGWIDRLGRALALVWLASPAFQLLDAWSYRVLPAL